MWGNIIYYNGKSMKKNWTISNSKKKSVLTSF